MNSGVASGRLPCVCGCCGYTTARKYHTCPAAIPNSIIGSNWPMATSNKTITSGKYIAWNRSPNMKLTTWSRFSCAHT